MRIIASILLLYSTCVVPLELFDYNLPAMGDSSSTLLTTSEEQLLGKEFMRSIRRQLNIEEDPIINSYIRNLGQRLVIASDNPQQPFNFFVVKDKTLNAFAGPGGNIGIHTGLITTTQSESELAAVVAHEVVHVTQKHLLRAFEAQQMRATPIAAAIIAAMVVGSQNTQAGQAIATTAMAGQMQGAIDFTRSNEKEADNIGMQVLFNAGFDPHGMPEFFGRLQRENRHSGHSLPEFLRTHPLTGNRVADASSRAAQYPQNNRANSKNSLRYLLVRERIRALGKSSSNRLIKHYQAEVSKKDISENTKLASHYGYALTLIQQRKPKDAKKHLQLLLQADRDEPAFVVAMAQVESDLGNFKKSEDLYSSALELLPNNYALTMAEANLLFANGKYADVANKLDKYLQSSRGASGSNKSAIHKLLADALGKTGQSAAAHFHLAEYFYLNGLTKDAIQHLRFARKYNANFYLSSRIDAKLKELEAQLEMEKKFKL